MRPFAIRLAALSVTAALSLGLLAGCGSKTPQPTAETQSPAPSEQAASSSAPDSGAAPTQPVALNGAGATFPKPLYDKWFAAYAEKTGVQINYQGIGSGGGQKQIIENTVDFAGSDSPMSDDDLAKAPGKLLHIPTVMGAVVVTYNLPGVSTRLKFDADTLAGIFLGEIKRWNDPKIKALNPEVNLPDLEIAVAHRSDGSGTTAVFTDYLAKVSPAWKEKVGADKAVEWPVGIGGKGNDGVAGLVKQTPGAIGYVELAYAEQNQLAFADLKNKAGKFVTPSLESTSAAAAGALEAMKQDVRVSITDADGENTYPIATFTYLLVYEDQTDHAKGEALVNFLNWMLEDGQQMAPELLYAPLPDEVKAMNRELINSIKY